MTKYVVSEIDGKTYCRVNGQFTRHLKSHGLTYREYYETYITGVKEVCPYCGEPKVFYSPRETYGDTCGKPKCVGRVVSEVKLAATEEEKARTNERRANTVLKKYGYTCITQTHLHKQKIAATMAEIMEDGRTRGQHMQEAARLGKLRKYGDPTYNNSEKIKASKAAHTEARKAEINERRRRTNIEKYGVENVLLLASSKARAANAKIKEYVLPSGKIIGVQGYEPKALDELLTKYDETSLMISDARNISNCGMPVIVYSDNQRHKIKYYPDIFIPSENKIIEVKSRWWFDGNGTAKYKSRYQNNMAKRNACESAGYLFEFWIYESDGTRKIL